MCVITYTLVIYCGINQDFKKRGGGRMASASVIAALVQRKPAADREVAAVKRGVDAAESEAAAAKRDLDAARLDLEPAGVWGALDSAPASPLDPSSISPPLPLGPIALGPISPLSPMRSPKSPPPASPRSPPLDAGEGAHAADEDRVVGFKRAARRDERNDFKRAARSDERNEGRGCGFAPRCPLKKGEMVTSGFGGIRGKLIGIDVSDGIVKTLDGDFHIVPLGTLGREW